MNYSSIDLPEKPVKPIKSNYETSYSNAQSLWKFYVGENGLNGTIYPGGIGNAEDVEYAYLSMLDDAKHDPTDIGMFMVR